MAGRRRFDQRLHTLLSAADADLLQALAADAGLSVAQMVRTRIRRGYVATRLRGYAATRHSDPRINQRPQNLTVLGPRAVTKTVKSELLLEKET